MPFMYNSYSGSYGSLGTRTSYNKLDVYDVDIQWPQGLTGAAERTGMARETFGTYTGSYGSLGSQTVWEWLDVQDGDI